jgi:SAM-dependent methyltransferase
MRSLLKDIAGHRAFALLREGVGMARSALPAPKVEPRRPVRRWSAAEEGVPPLAAAGSGLSGDLARLLRRLGATSLLDIGCGAAEWLAPEGIGALYVGVDSDATALGRAPRGVPESRFVKLDARRDPLPRADAVLMRDVLCRMDLSDAFLVLEAVCRSGARHLIATTDLGRDVNIAPASAGGR